MRSLILVLWLANYTFSLNARQSGLNVPNFLTVFVVGSSCLSQIFPGLLCSEVC